jgi:hypothetical protein
MQRMHNSWQTTEINDLNTLKEFISIFSSQGRKDAGYVTQNIMYVPVLIYWTEMWAWTNRDTDYKQHRWISTVYYETNKKG